MKKEILMAVMILGLLSCKKKEEPATKVETTETPDPCFNSQYSGTYHGYGNTSVSTFSAGGTLVLSKTGCESCSISLNSPSGSFSDNITQLTLNSGGGYSGKQSNGNSITIVLGSHLDVKATGSYTYTGQKQ